MSDVKIRELERRFTESPEAQADYLRALERAQGFYPPALPLVRPLWLLELHGELGDEQVRLLLEGHTYLVEALERQLDQRFNVTFLDTAVSAESLRRIQRWVGMSIDDEIVNGEP
jgi:hypothetical protein